MTTDPRTYKVSPNFVLADFLGNHTVYSRGHRNLLENDDQANLKLENLRALCFEALEPILEAFGPMTIAYGYISPGLSRGIVKYQDPDKPSHHRFDLGAAADICVHRWVDGQFKTPLDMYLPVSAIGSPIALAHTIDNLDIPYSRLITYSESPYICLAVSAKEVVSDTPRKAFYENRFVGKKKTKPDYRQYPTQLARDSALHRLQSDGLPVDWCGGGYPSYHAGGIQQYQHMRVSKYTMVSDWLFDLKSISNGKKNIPCLHMGAVQDAFAAAGTVYDSMLETLNINRMSIVEGYVSHLSPFTADHNDWRNSTIRFSVVLPAYLSPANAMEELESALPDGAQFTLEEDFLVAVVNVETVLKTWS